VKEHIYLATHCQTRFNRNTQCDCSAEMMALNAEKFFKARHSCTSQWESKSTVHTQ